MLGLIGGGYWGKNLVREFNSLNILHTICDVNEELLSQYKNQYPHINLETNFDTMINNSEISMVCISLPAHMHYDFTLRALNAGKHVYVEKPFTLDIVEAIKLDEYAKEKNLVLMVGHLLHYHEAVKMIKRLINTENIGKVKSITCNRKSHGIYRTFENVLWSFAVHDISVLLSLTKSNASQVNILSCNGHGNIMLGIEDVVNTCMLMNDVYVNLNVDWNCPNKEQRMTIVCEKAIIVFDDVSKDEKLKIIYNYSKESNNGPVANKNDYEIIDIGNSSPLKNECEYFIECVKNNQEPITNGDEAIEVLKVLKMCDQKLLKEDKTFFAHHTCAIESDNIGKGTKIWRWSHISKTGQIGDNCNIGQGCEIAGIIGNGCKVQNNTSIYKGVEAGNNVFFGPSCVLTNDMNPKCEYPKNGQYIKTVIKDGATLGANCTIVCGNTIGKYAFVGAGSVVTRDVPDYAVVVGNPAKRIGTIDKYGNITHDEIGIDM